MPSNERMGWTDKDLSNVTRSPLYIVKGRSQDGTVWSMGGTSWSPYRKDALRMINDEAQEIVRARRERNQVCDIDMAIGQLEIIRSK